MYIRQTEDGGLPCIYSLEALRKDHPTVSFPADPDADLLAAYGLSPCTPSPGPEFDPLTEKLVTGPLVQDGAHWVQTWVVEPKPIDEAAAAVRMARDAKLSSSDWRVIMHMDLGTPIPPAWAAYRQALRDLPEQPGFPFTHTWPVEPE